MITSAPGTSPLTPAAPQNPFAQFTQGFEAPTPPPTEIGVSGFESPTPAPGIIEMPIGYNPNPGNLPAGNGVANGGTVAGAPAGFSDVGAGIGQPAAPIGMGGGDFQLPEQGMLPGYRPVKRRPFGAGGY